MKILMLTPYLPYPLYSGGQTRSFNLIKNLSKNNEITLFSFIRNEGERKFINQLAPYCRKVQVFKRRPAWAPVNIILSGLTLYPFLVVIYLSRTLRSALQKELRNNKFDLIHAETFYVLPNIPKTKIPTLLVEQTIEYQVYQHFVDSFNPEFLKPLLLLDVLKVKRWESHFWRKVNKVVAVSDDDKRKMVSLVGNLDVEVVPNGVDPGVFSAKKYHHRPADPIILYVGNFKWLQNREAVEILITKIWPIINKEIPQSRLWIVGRSQTEGIKKLAGQNVVFKENITDIQSAYRQADVLLAPIYGPGGTRLKVLEAMVSGCPVVTTKVGVEGLGVQNGQEVLIGNTSKELAGLTIRLLQDKELQVKLGERARQHVSQKYNWPMITARLEKIYKEVCDVS